MQEEGREDKIESIRARKTRPSPVDVVKEGLIVDGKSVQRLKRADPILYGTLEELAQYEGKPVEEIIRESIIHSVKMKQFVMSEMTVDQLYTAWLILAEMMDFSRDLFFKYAKMMFSQETQDLIELRKAVQEQVMEQKPSVIAEEKVEEKRSTIKEKLLNYVEIVMDGILDNIISGYTKKDQQMKVPVEYKEIGSGETNAENKV